MCQASSEPHRRGRRRAHGALWRPQVRCGAVKRSGGCAGDGRNGRSDLLGASVAPCALREWSQRSRRCLSINCAALAKRRPGAPMRTVEQGTRCGALAQLQDLESESIFSSILLAPCALLAAGGPCAGHRRHFRHLQGSSVDAQGCDGSRRCGITIHAAKTTRTHRSACFACGRRVRMPLEASRTRDDAAYRGTNAPSEGLPHTNGTSRPRAVLPCPALHAPMLAWHIAHRSVVQRRLEARRLSHSLQRSRSCWRRILVPRPWEAFR